MIGKFVVTNANQEVIKIVKILPDENPANPTEDNDMVFSFASVRCDKTYNRTHDAKSEVDFINDRLSEIGIDTADHFYVDVTVSPVIVADDIEPFTIIGKTQKRWLSYAELLAVDIDDPWSDGFECMESMLELSDQEAIDHAWSMIHERFTVYPFFDTGSRLRIGETSRGYKDGFMFATNAEIANEKIDQSKIQQTADGELETVSDWAYGKIYGYQTYSLCNCCQSEILSDDADGSCWGYYGLDYLKDELLQDIQRNNPDHTVTYFDGF